MYTIHSPLEVTTRIIIKFVAVMFTVDNVLSILVLKECINYRMKVAEVFEFTHNTFNYHNFNFYSTVDTR